MVARSIGLGALLIILGAVGYLASGAESVTALIPAFFGIPILILGLLGRKEHLRKHMMHAVAALALLGFAGSVRGLGALMSMLGGHDVPRPLATIMQSLMALFTFAFVLFAIKSFIDARRQRVSPRPQEP
ncbi:MAG: hypothetical protein RBU27_01355 [Bacteroidota bacterium]|jgi:hypothetical protein|nr:hypothetical protein [Bacteroidota bacterium]